MVAMNTIDAAVARMLSGFEDFLIILILRGLVACIELAVIRPLTSVASR